MVSTSELQKTKGTVSLRTFTLKHRILLQVGGGCRCHEDDEAVIIMCTDVRVCVQFLHKLTARALIRDYEDGSLDTDEAEHEVRFHGSLGETKGSPPRF